MSEFGGGSSEVSESTEVSETPPEETGGESSEATQEAATEEANESGGFDDTEHTEAPDSNEDTEDMDSEDDGDESQDVGFEDGDDIDNTDSQPDDVETYEDDNISDADEDQIGFDDSDEPDGIDDGDIKDEDPEIDPDGKEADEEPDGSPDGDPDGDTEDDTIEDDQDIDDDFDDEEDTGELEDYSDESEDDTVEDNQDVDDDTDIEDENPEVDPDGNEAEEDPDGSPDGNPDGDSEKDVIEDDQDVDDKGDIQDEDPEANPDGNEADEDLDDSPDGEPDGDPEDDATEDDQDIDDDFEDEEDYGELEDYSDESEDDSLEDDQDVDDDTDIQDEDSEADHDGNEADEDSDGSLEGDPENDAIEDDQDVADDGDVQDKDPEADPNGNEADEKSDGSPDGNPEGNPEDDTVEDDQDVVDDGDIQDEDPEADINGNEADEDLDDTPDGDPEDDTIEDDLYADEDFDDEEDTGELEDYSDDSENNADSNDEADGEAERDQEEEELAEEKANEEAAEEAEDAVSEDANKLAEDEADPVEDENQKLLESQPEDSAENNESGDESNENEHMDDAPEEANEPEEDIDSESKDDLNDELEDSEEYQDEGEPENYDDEKPVDPVSDTKDDQEAPSETDADDKVSKTAEESEKEDAYRTAMNNMADYLNSHNYGREDYAEYSKDPEWQKLNADLQRSLGMEVTTDVPETSTPSPEGGKEVSSTEPPDNCVVVNASDIDMTYAQGMDSDQFWNHHGNTKEDYMRVAEKLPDVQQALDSDKSIDELKNDPELGETVRAYYDPDNMIKVEQQPDGSYSFTDDGRHRIAAAQELGYEIPVDVTNAEKPIDSQSNTKISDNPSDSKNNLDSGDSPENQPLPPEGGDGPDNPPPPPEGGDGSDNPPPPPEGDDGPSGPPEKEFGKEQLNVAAHGDGQIWVKSSDIKDKLDSIGRPDLSAKVDEAIDKLKSGDSKASEEFVSVMREAGNELRKNEDTVDCGNALLNLVDNDEQALKVEAENGAQEYKGLVQENNKQVEGASEAPNPEDLNRKQDIGSETRENLGSFEQSKWDNLSQVEKEQAVEKLRDSIAEDLQLENKPNIAYYYKESPSDFGGYAASTNTIYINRFNMDNAGETADTIAHESRHCWQHERAENPQTEQDYKFKENFEDYIRPEDDFYEYQCQPVEADARDYAQVVKDAIPEPNEIPDVESKQNYENNVHQNEDAPPSTTGPPDVANEKAESSKLPEDFEQKVDIPLEQKIAEVNQNIADISEDPLLDSREKAEKIAKELNAIGFEKVDTTTVLGFADQKIEVVQMDGSQTLYRRGYETEGQGKYGYGSWWSEKPMSIEDTRNKLAVCESWGNPLTGEYQAKPEKGTLALKGTAAPQEVCKNGTVVEQRSGGETQYYIETPNKDWCSKSN